MGIKRGDFTEEPEEGWLHDDTALAMGEGVFYSYPLTLLGHVQIEQSLSKLDRKYRTLAIEEMMVRLLTEAGRLKEKKRKIRKEYKDFTTGKLTYAGVPVSLGIAADGMVIIPNIPGMSTEEDPKILFYHTMPVISVAAGGSSHDTYTLVAYVAKDEDRKRSCFVFDCEDEETSDEVLATLGQSFLLAQDLAAKRRERPKKKEVKEYLETSPTYDVGETAEEEPVYDTGSSEPVTEEPMYDTGSEQPAEEPLYDTGDEPVAPAAPEYDIPKAEAVPEYDVGETAEEEPIYDVPTSDIISKLNAKDQARRSVRQSMRTSTKAGRKSMKQRESIRKKRERKSMKAKPATISENVDLNEVDMRDAARPSWVCISEADAEDNKMDLSDLLRDFKLGAVEEIIEEEDDE